MGRFSLFASCPGPSQGPRLLAEGPFCVCGQHRIDGSILALAPQAHASIFAIGLRLILEPALVLERERIYPCVPGGEIALDGDGG